MKRAYSGLSNNVTKLPQLDERKPAAAAAAAAVTGATGIGIEEAKPSVRGDMATETNVSPMAFASAKKPPPMAGKVNPTGKPSKDGAIKKKARAKKPNASQGKAAPPIAKLLGSKKRPIGEILEEEAPENETAEERRLRRNRINDRRKRARRAMKVEFLNEQFHTLQKQNEEMRTENKALRDRIAAIRRMQGLEDTKAESSGSEEPETNKQSDLLVSAAHRSRLDGTIMAAMNRSGPKTAVPSSAPMEIQGEGEPQDAKADKKRPQVPQDLKPPSHDGSQPSGADFASASHKQEENSALDQLRASLGQPQTGVEAVAALQPSLSGNVSTNELMSLLQQHQQHQEHQGLSVQQVVSLLQSQRSNPSAALLRDQNQNGSALFNDLQGPRRLPGQGDQLSALLQLHQQRNNPALLATLAQQRNQGATTDQAALLSLLQQQAQGFEPNSGVDLLASLQAQNQAQQESRNHLLALLQQQQQPQPQQDNLVLAQLVALQQEQRRADEDARRQLISLLQPQQQRAEPSLAQLLLLHQGQTRGAGPAQLLTSLLHNQDVEGTQEEKDQTAAESISARRQLEPTIQRGEREVSASQRSAAKDAMQAQQGSAGPTAQDLLASIRAQSMGGQGQVAALLPSLNQNKQGLLASLTQRQTALPGMQGQEEHARLRYLLDTTASQDRATSQPIPAQTAGASAATSQTPNRDSLVNVILANQRKAPSQAPATGAPTAASQREESLLADALDLHTQALTKRAQPSRSGRDPPCGSPTNSYDEERSKKGDKTPDSTASPRSSRAAMPRQESGQPSSQGPVEAPMPAKKQPPTGFDEGEILHQLASIPNPTFGLSAGVNAKSRNPKKQQWKGSRREPSFW